MPPSLEPSTTSVGSFYTLTSHPIASCHMTPLLVESSALVNPLWKPVREASSGVVLRKHLQIWSD